MTMSDRSSRWTETAPVIRHEADTLADMADQLALLSVEEAERLIESYVSQAIARWQIADATFWQRVRYRSRLIRAYASCHAAPADDVDKSSRAH